MQTKKNIDPSSFEIIGISDNHGDTISRPRVGYFKDAWRRFKENKVALVSMVILLIIITMVIIGPYLSGYNYEEVNKLERKQSPSAKHWFGTDKLGRDLFARVCVGGRVSIIIGLAGAFISSVIGCIYGGIAAYFGGKVDTIMMRIVEVIISIPYLIVVILMSILFNSKSLGTLILAMTITGWCGMARMVRAQMLQIKSEDYILAAQAMGVSPLKIVMKHMIPNTISVVIVSITFRIPGYIFSEAFLSYIGLGIQPPGTSWGALASSAQGVFTHYPYQLFFPAFMIALTMLSFTLMGDGLRDALDPRLRK
ncbi:ABC transporter permease [Clostridium sp. 'deep sea']|uniref:ABC transporter permease n=1 Tax=Clostridium sp. 'deep sea' TaxID=2779445 RepID=UPI0018969AB7|nr:ABC transporter permease [Clostridium sp. 'deep sea']QOR36092.1 ABC transporter permease [Clostridium sp. 'deep sea']